MRGRTRLILALGGVGGLLMLVAANRFGRPELIGPGLLLFAGGTLAAGADAILRRYTVERRRDVGITTFHGSAAILIGLVLLVISLILAAAGISFLIGAEDRLYALLEKRPGGALLALGSIGLGTGGARLLGAREWKGSAGRLLANLPERFAGMLLVVVGLALVALGAFEVAAPAAFDHLLGGFAAPWRATGVQGG